MKKWISYGILIAVLGGWLYFYQMGAHMRAMEREVEQLLEKGDPEDRVDNLRAEIETTEGHRTTQGVLLAVVSAGVLGIFFAFVGLPGIAQKVTNAIYGGGEEAEADPMHEARAFLAQGEYQAAVDAFEQAAQKDPANRMPWLEIAKIQRTHLDGPVAAIASLKEALENHAWPPDDAAALLFRMAEIYDEDLKNRPLAESTLREVIARFTGTLHSAKARDKLREWGIV